MNPAAHGRTREEGAQLIEELWKRDLTLMASPHVADVGIGEMANILAARRLRVFSTLIGWTSEYPLYRRDEKGKPNDDECPLIACTALLAPIAPRMPAEDDVESDGDQWGRGRSSVTGY
jgi:hypothetical protein